MSWREQDWDDSYEALEEAVKAVRKAQRTMLDRRMSYGTKVEQVTVDLHRMRRSLDECCAAMEQTDAEAKAYALLAA